MSFPTPPQTDPRQQSRGAGPLDDEAALPALLPPRGVSTPPLPAGKKKPRKKRQPAPEIRPVDVLGISPEIDTNLVMVELGAVAFSNICDLFGPDDRFLPPSEMPQVAGRTVAR